MAWTTKLLVIANRTVDSETLREILLGRAARGPIELTLVAPASREAGDAITGRAVTQERLDRAVERMRDAGLQVEGVLGAGDPMVALQDVWDPRRFDEVVVATLPGGTSRWLTFDLPHRVERFTGARVTHIVADAAHEPVA